MSETDTQAAVDSEPQSRDPADPVDAAAAIREELAQAERNYRANLQREQQRAAQAETRVAQVSGQLETEQQTRAQLEFSTVANALETARTLAGSLQGQYAAAMEAGDFKKAGEISLEIGRVGSRIETLEAGKAEMEAQRNQALRQPARQETQQQSQGDPIEAQLARMDARAAAWIRQQTDAQGRPRFFTDQSFGNKVRGAHFEALAEGLPENGPEYFKFVEGKIGVAQQQNGGNGDGQQRRSVPAAAPPRAAGAYRDGGGRQAGDSVPSDVVTFCRNVLGFNTKDGKPDMIAIKNYWSESRSMAQSGKFKEGDPWAGAR